MKDNAIRNFFDFAIETAYQAGRITLGFYQTRNEIQYKSNLSPVTQADIAAETYIRERIQDHFPTHAIIGEEFGSTNTNNEMYKWFIDPIDGTKSFMRGVPLFAVLVGLEIEGTIQVGVAYFPALDEMIAAGRNLGCWWNGRRAYVSKVNNLGQAFLTCTSTKFFTDAKKKAVWEKLLQECYFQAGWGDAYGYLLVATGRAEIMIDPIMNPWDSAPFPPILEEAGGYFGDWNGNSNIYNHEALAINSQLKDEVLAITSGYGKG